MDTSDRRKHCGQSLTTGAQNLAQQEEQQQQATAAHRLKRGIQVCRIVIVKKGEEPRAEANDASSIALRARLGFSHCEVLGYTKSYLISVITCFVKSMEKSRSANVLKKTKQHHQRVVYMHGKLVFTTTIVLRIFSTFISKVCSIAFVRF